MKLLFNINTTIGILTLILMAIHSFVAGRKIKQWYPQLKFKLFSPVSTLKIIFFSFIPIINLGLLIVLTMRGEEVQTKTLRLVVENIRRNNKNESEDK